MRKATFLAGVLSSVLICACGASSVGLQSLLREMIDMEGLSRFPAPHFKTIQFSSYDRRSRKPYGPNWYANSDGFGREPIPGFLRVSRKPDRNGLGTYVMVDVKGPGAIVRTWTALIRGRIRLFLDDLSQPFYDGPAQAFLSDPYSALLGQSPQPNGFKQREAAYFPIPFAKRCLIEWIGRKSDVHFYQIQVRVYPPGTSVKTLSRKELKAAAPLIQKVSEILSDARKLPVPAGRDTAFEETLKPEERKVLLSLEKESGAISLLRFTLESPDPRAALRGTVLRVSFDGAPNPQVLAPLGDFFGAGPGINPYVSLPMQVEPDGAMTCRFFMPFARSVRLELENWSEVSARVRGVARISPYRWEENRSMHFFASYRVDHDLWARHMGEVIDLPFLCARGKGVYVGTAALIMNPTAVPTPAGGWWGEGDEKIWVDDDTVPSTFGTGSEDYFNYAWSAPDHFAYAYAAQPLVTGPGNRGYVANIRWQILDSLPFKRSIFFFMELFPHLPVRELSYGRIAYFYAFPETRDDRVPLRPALLKVPPLPPYLPQAAGACRNAVFFQAENLAAVPSGGIVSYPADPAFAGGRALKWNPQAPEAFLEILLPVSRDGIYSLGFTVAHTPEADHMKVTLNGEAFRKDGAPVALRTPYNLIIRNALGDRNYRLKAGRYRIRIISVNREGKPTKAPVTIDYVWLIKR